MQRSTFFFKCVPSWNESRTIFLRDSHETCLSNYLSAYAIFFRSNSFMYISCYNLEKVKTCSHLNLQVIKVSLKSLYQICYTCFMGHLNELLDKTNSPHVVIFFFCFNGLQNWNHYLFPHRETIIGTTFNLKIITRGRVKANEHTKWKDKTRDTLLQWTGR